MIYKILFGLFAIASLVMLVQSIQIVFYYHDELNSHGFGFVTGKLLLFVLFGLLAFFIGRRIFKVKQE
ncbi:MAG: hypothetical protein AAF616_09550 [Bacteroidota bacterium]